MTAQQKTLVTLLLATIVAGGLGLYAYFGVMKPAARTPDAREALPAEAGTSASGADTAPPISFTSMSLWMPLGSTQLELREGVWFVTAPVLAPASRSRVDMLLTELSRAKFKATLEEHPTDEDLVRYGLKPPKASVTARGYVPDANLGGAQEASRQRTVNFQVGRTNSFDNSVYVRREGDPRVYLAPGSLQYSLMRPPNDWREPQVFNGDEASLLRIEVKARKNSLTLERVTTDKPWQLVKPVAMPADSQRVARMVTGLREHTALSFPDARLEPQVRQALEKPQVEATFVPRNGGPIHVRLAELKLPGAPPQVFELCTGDSGSVLAQVNNTALEVLDVPSQDFKDKKVLELELHGVREILIHPAGRGEALKLERALDTDRWEVVAPMPGLVRESKLAALLNGLVKLQAAAIGEAQPRQWSRYGISDDSQGVSLRDGSGQDVARLWVGSPVKDNPQRVWARGSSGDVLELDKAALDALPLTLEELLDTSSGLKR